MQRERVAVALAGGVRAHQAPRPDPGADRPRADRASGSWRSTRAKLQTLSEQGLPSMLYVVAAADGARCIGIVAMVVRRRRRLPPPAHLRRRAATSARWSSWRWSSPRSGSPAAAPSAGSCIGGFQLQPSEIAKVAVLVAVAAVLHERKGEPGLPTVGVCLALTAVPMGLVFLQPDLGTSIVFVVAVRRAVPGRRRQGRATSPVLGAAGVAARRRGLPGRLDRTTSSNG